MERRVKGKTRKKEGKDKRYKRRSTGRVGTPVGRKALPPGVKVALVCHLSVLRAQGSL